MDKICLSKEQGLIFTIIKAADYKEDKTYHTLVCNAMVVRYMMYLFVHLCQSQPIILKEVIRKGEVRHILVVITGRRKTAISVNHNNLQLRINVLANTTVV